MELELPSINILLGLLFSSYCIILLLIKQWKTTENRGKLLPSPPKLPVIGHLHLMVGRLPQHVLTRAAQKYGPVMHLQLGEIFSVVVSSREATKQVMKGLDPACADRADSIGTKIMWYDNKDLIFSPYNAHWRQMRKICVSELLNARNEKSFGFIREDEMSRLVRFLRSSAGQAVNMTEKITATTCSIICRAAFGSVVRDDEVLIGLVKTASGMANGFELADLFPSSKLLNLLCLNKYRLWKMRRKLDAILEGVVEEHKLKQSGEFGGEDIVDVLLRMQKNSQLQFPITTDTIKGFIFDTFAAGTETSSTTTVWAMAELMKNPRVMANVQAEVREGLKGKKSVDASDVQQLKYLKSVVKETLRLHPPFPLIPRKCREDIEVEGYSIPSNSRIVINVWSLGRDPLYWEEPEIFWPERFDHISTDYVGNNFEFIPFGGGRRICPGLNLGVANVEVPLAQLLYHFDWKLGEPGMSPVHMDMTVAKGLSGPRKTPLFLVPSIYIPTQP
ncbi:hypothetical protein C2S53_016279 [Perilla frutescens var. hirtella]|uniref:Cytochrome P450 n=1 Tax=Perilla frutescens var. hirtella TaxID=608512 RepID=A0AAD4JNH9_PERFH|nr:hypothetical protein C2S53_016279 [Perilla frutescens var. hirtella]